MALAARVLDTIRRRALLRRGDRVLVARSGGSDSVALLRLLRELEASGELTVAGVAHLNHGLRAAATDDEQFCRALAGEAGVPFRSDLVDVRARAARLGTSLEDAGRQARYELFERVATELGAGVIATGHTRDDQAETFLLRLLRGAGPRGLGGIHPKTPVPAYLPERHPGLPAEAPKARRWVVRPVLECSRDELRAYLASLGQPFREDESNRDLSLPRNRVRHELLPLLARDYSPGITAVLARAAESARLDEDRLQQDARELVDLIVLRSERGPAGEVEAVELDVRALDALHPAVAVRVVRLALDRVVPGRFVGFDHAERLLELARDPRGHGALSLPGQHAERRGETLVLSRRHDPPEPFTNSFQVSLSIPGEVVLAAQGWAISATPSAAVNGREAGGWHLPGTGASHPVEKPVEDPVEKGDGLEQAVAADGLTLPLAVRSRRPGDRFRPLGMGGREKKLQDLLVDRKVARDERDSLPLVVDSADKIVWVVGESVSEDFRITGASQAVIFLKARRLGGQG
jgi:tRNA(Ile)-lysidine synthase